MSRLSLKLLGPPEVLLDGQPLKFRTKKALALLAYLAVEGGLRLREKLAALLWPESDEARSRTMLRSTLAGLRDALLETTELSKDAHLLVDRTSLGLDLTSGVELDLHVLEAAYAQVRTRHLEDDVRRGVIARLRAATAAYRGEFMEGFSVDDAPEFDYWISMQREAWRAKASTVFDRLSQLKMEGGQFGEALDTATGWVARDPLNELAYRRLMEAQFAVGDRIGAIRTYETCRKALDRLGTEPAPEIEALAARIRAEPPLIRHTTRLSSRGQGLSAKLPHAPLVGRAAEFGALIEGYYAACRGQTLIVAVVGEVGIGKTRLAEEFLIWARTQGAEVLRGRAFETAGLLPYELLVSAIRARVDRERAPDDLLPDVWLSELSRLLPELRERYPDLPPPGDDEAIARTHLYEAVARLIKSLSERAPVVLFFDDVQWADPDSLDALQYAGRRWAEEGVSVLCVVSLRSEELATEPTLANWLSSLERQLDVERLSLGPLTVEDTVDLLRAMGEPESGDGENASREDLERLGRWLFAETGGQPFFVVQTLKTLIQQGVLGVSLRPNGRAVLDVTASGPGLPGSVLPSGMRDIVRARLSRLASATSELLYAAAILGQGFSFEHLCRVADLKESDGLRALDEVLQSHLIREAGQDTGHEDEVTYAFVHDKIRDVVYTEAGEARRRVFHRRALEVLETTSHSAAKLAYHALAAGLPVGAFRHSLAAGDEAMRVFAVRDAVTQYERARTLLKEADEHVLEPALSAENIEHLYMNLGRAHEFVGEWEPARDAYGEMLAYARRAGDHHRLECVALNRLAILAAQRSFDLPTAIALLKEARGLAKASGDGIARAETERNLAQIYTYSLEFDAAVAHGEKALELARELGLKELEARGFATLAAAHGTAGRWEECVVSARDGASLYAAMEESRADAEALSAQYVWAGSPSSIASSNRATRAQCLCLLAVGEVNRGSPRAGVEAGREALKLSRELNNEWMRAHSISDLNRGLLEVGEYEEALQTAREGVDIARKIHSPPLLFFMLAALGNTYQTLLALEEARTAYEEALAAVETPASRRWEAIIVPHLCANRVLAGDWEEAHAHALQAAALRDELPALLIWGDFDRHYEVEALLKGGDEALARKDVRRFGERIGENRRYRITYLRSQGVLLRWSGESEAAIEHLLEARSLTEDIVLPNELWQIEAALGDLYQESGQKERAEQTYARAAEVIRALAAKLNDETLREGFLAAPQVWRVLELSLTTPCSP